jgi:hypothetical protein
VDCLLMVKRTSIHYSPIAIVLGSRSGV